MHEIKINQRDLNISIREFPGVSEFLAGGKKSRVPISIFLPIRNFLRIKLENGRMDRQRDLTDFVSDSEGSPGGPRTDVRIDVPAAVAADDMVRLRSGTRRRRRVNKKRRRQNRE